MSDRTVGRRALRTLGCLGSMLLWLLLFGTAWAQGPDRILTVAVLVNSTNTTGFSTNPLNPGEFQRYPERYLEHLQVPYQLLDVSAGAPPDLSRRQLIVAGHRGLNPSAAWQTAISNAVSGGVGFVNLDWDVNVGNQTHIRNIFVTSASAPGTPGTAVSIPAAVRVGGATPHWIAALQQAFQGDTTGPNGQLVYNFHTDAGGTLRTATSTVLAGAQGTVIATIGTNPLILATSFGQGRGVHFGTLDYLRADRFGFVQGVDDLFWRSLVWAARKPFVLRGYPKLWSVQMDDTLTGWGSRVKDLYNPSLTGSRAADGTGGPWKVTGYVFLNHLSPGNAERASVIADVNANSLDLVPHAFANTQCGDLYWNGPLLRQFTDAEWLANVNQVMQWKQGNGGADTIPPFSRAMVPHFWDLGNNTGSDLWNTFGFRYVTSILKPGFQNCNNPNGSERLKARPFWLYEQPPKKTTNEDVAFFFADDYPVNSRAGQPSQNLYLFASQLQDPNFYPRPDVTWPSGSFGLTASIEQFKRYTWRFWSSMAPVQIFTHDSVNYVNASVADRQQVIQNVSSWLNPQGVRHVFMEELGDYIYARNKSLLTDVSLTGSNVTYVFTGNATTANSVPVNTNILMFFNNTSEGVPQNIPGFSGGLTLTQPLAPAPPEITGISPTSGPTAGGTIATISGSAFLNVVAVRIGGTAATSFVVNSSTSISVNTPPGSTGLADVTVVAAAGTATLPGGFTYLGPPTVASIDPTFGPVGGGTSIQVSGQGFEPSSTVRVGGTLATNVTVFSSTSLTAVTPPGAAGPASVAVTNSFGTTTVPGAFHYGDVIHLDFNYGSRAALIAGGWNFLARTAGGLTRDTEQTSGLVVNYDQASHPGVIRIPVDQGDIYQNLNSSRNTLFYTLPETWRSLKLRIASFTPNGNYQLGALVAYQDDDNYVLINKFYENGSLFLEFAQETAGQYFVIQRVAAPAGATIFFRLDRDVTSGAITAFRSTNGTTWTQFSGSATQAINNPRLGVFVGANDAGATSNADIAFAEIAVSNDPPIIGTSPSSLSFSVFQGGGNPPDQTLQITNTGGGVVSWSATDNVSWLSLNPTGGVAPSSVVVSVNAAGLAVGTYQANITITSAGAANSPRVVPVTFTVSTPVAPTITGISPGGGTTAGGTPVQITGSGFVSSGTLTIGGAAATNVFVTSSSSISAVTPPGVAGRRDVVFSSSAGSATLAGGFLYTAPGGQFLRDDFSSGTATGWTISPMGNAAGWSVTGGVYSYNGAGHSQSYQGDTSWTDYTLTAKIRLSTLNNYPGGLRGRINPSTGAGYVLWMYPATRELRLYRATAWFIDSPGLALLGTASNIAFDTVNFHTLRMTFRGSFIDVYYDGTRVMSVSDTAYTSGVIALDAATQPIQFDNVTVWFGVPALSALASTPASVTFPVIGATQQLKVIGTQTDGDTSDVTSDPSTTYVSSNPPAAQVNATGLVTAVANGAASINISSSGATTSVPVTVDTGTVTVTSITPTSGSTNGGTSIQISGTGFASNTTVSVGGAAASNVVAGSSTSLTATTPPGVAGPADVIVTTGSRIVTVAGGFTYVPPGGLLLRDDFAGGTANGWTISPMGGAANWSVVNGAFAYSGGGNTQEYRGSTWWSDYTFTAKFRLSTLSNYPGGIRGRVNPTTGAGYAAWLYPANGQIRLYRVPAWNINGPGLTQLGVVGSIPFDTTGFHTLRMTFRGSIIDVYYDGTLVLSVTDTTYTNGVVALDVDSQPIQYDDVTVWFGVPTSQALLVTPPASTLIQIGATQQLRVTAVQPNGNGVDVTNSAATTYVSNNTAAVQVNATGLTSAVASGVARIDIANNGATTSALVTVDTTVVTIGSVSPSTGPAAGGTSIQVSGTGFAAGTTVTVGGAAATNVVVTSSTSLTASTPAGVAGPADVTVSIAGRSATLAGGYFYGPPGGQLLVDNFSSGTATGWTISPMGGGAGWSVVNGAYAYNGGGASQSWRGATWWTDYSFTTRFRLANLSNFPGGIRGRVNTATGAGYAVWLYPATRELKLFRATGWDINSPGLALLASVSGVVVDTTNFHALRLTFRGSTIDVLYDGVLMMSVIDSSYTSGVIALDGATQPITFDDVTVIFDTLSVSPASGPTSGGTAIEILGSGFTGASTVAVGGTPATNVVVTSSTRITAVTPPGAAGPTDVAVTTGSVLAMKSAGFTYVTPAGVTLLSDNFTDGVADGWLISPLGNAAGWSVLAGAYHYNGGGHTQSYRGESWWSDYSFEAKVRLSSLNNFPGGIRARVNPATGAGYAVWLYPSTGEIKLYSATGWNIDSPGLALLGNATGIPFTSGTLHTVRLNLRGQVLEVYYDGTLVISVHDAAYRTGAIALDVGNQPIDFDDIVVTTLP